MILAYKEKMYTQVMCNAILGPVWNQLVFKKLEGPEPVSFLSGF
jgi:hypothetical protein